MWPFRQPDVFIGGRENPYMRRWHVVPRNKWFNIYLHNMLRSDEDAALHDHPGWNISLVLWRGYIEVMPMYFPLYPELALNIFHPPYLVRKRRWPGQVVYRRARDPHRLEIDKPAWTLWIGAPKSRTWGFWCPKGWRSWKEFVGTDYGTIGRGCGDD